MEKLKRNSRSNKVSFGSGEGFDFSAFTLKSEPEPEDTGIVPDYWSAMRTFRKGEDLMSNDFKNQWV